MKKKYDVIFAGSGFANAILAYRLKQVKPHLEMLIIEKKKELTERLTETLSDVLGTPSEATWVIVEEHDKENWAIGGVRFSEK